MTRMTQVDDLACQLLKFEQELKAYEKLHATELAELWQALNDCKETVAAIVSSNEPTSSDEVNNSEEDAHSLASVGSGD